MNLNDVNAAATALKTALLSLLEGTFSILSVPAVFKACQKLKGQKGSGQELMRQLVQDLVEEKPELIDLAFAGLSEVAKNRIRKAMGTPEVKDAEQL